MYTLVRRERLVGNNTGRKADMEEGPCQFYRITILESFAIIHVLEFRIIDNVITVRRGLPQPSTTGMPAVPVLTSDQGIDRVSLCHVRVSPLLSGRRKTGSWKAQRHSSPDTKYGIFLDPPRSQ